MTHTAPTQEARDFAAARFDLMNQLARTPRGWHHARAQAAFRMVDDNERMSPAEKTAHLGSLSRYLDRHA